MCYLYSDSPILFKLTGSQIHSMHRVLRIFLFLLFLASSGPATAAEPQPSPSAASPPPTAAPEPTPIPLAKIPLEAESTLATLQEISASVSKDESAANLIAANLANLAAEIDSRVADDSRLLSSSQTLDTLHRMTVIWQKFSDNLSGLARELAECAKNLDQEIARLNRLQRAWQVSVSAARQPDTPPAVLERAQSTSDSVTVTLKRTELARASVLTAQTRLSEEQARVQTALTSVQQLQTSALKSLVVRDSPPIWQLGSELDKEWETQLGRTSAAQLKASAAFTERLPFTFLVHGLVILADRRRQFNGCGERFANRRKRSRIWTGRCRSLISPFRPRSRSRSCSSHPFTLRHHV